MRRRTWWGLALGVWLVTLAAPVQAVDEPHGFTVSPAFQEVKVNARADSPFAFSITNHTDRYQNFSLDVQDVGAKGEDGSITFLDQGANELEHKYGLASWLELGESSVFVDAGKTVQIPVTIRNRESLAPGGHYGAVLATAVDDFGKPVKDTRVGLKQIVASLVLAIKEGGLIEELNLVGQSHNGTAARLPSLVEQRFANIGNVHLVPRGLTEVRDTVGRVVARGATNEESAIILPQSYRRYKVPLVQTAPALLPGLYRVESRYRYDGTENTKLKVSTFWYAGSLIVWLVILLMLAAVGALVWWLWLRPRRGRRVR